MSNTTTTSAPAWAFVLRHLSYLHGLAHRSRFRRAFVDPDEFMSELVLDVVNAIDLFDPTRGTEEQWIWTRAMLTATRNDRARARALRHEPFGPDESDTPVRPGGRGSAEHVYTVALVREVMDHATASQRAACDTVLRDLDGPAVREELGISLHGRNYRLHTLRDALEKVSAPRSR